jgi:phosphocarrier protein
MTNKNYCCHCSSQVTLLNELGLHARPAAKLAQEAQKFKASIKLQYGDREVDAKSILDILTLAVPGGSTLTLCADGEDAEDAIFYLKQLFAEKFGEEK